MASRRGSKKSAGTSSAEPAEQTKAQEAADKTTAETTNDTAKGAVSDKPATGASDKPAQATEKTPAPATKAEAAKDSSAPDIAKSAEAPKVAPKSATAAKSEISAKADDGGGVKDTGAKPASVARTGAAEGFDPYRDDDLRDDDLRHPRLDDHHEDEHGQRSLAATAFAVLVGVIVIASLTLWAAPKLAPHLPAGVGKYLMPGEMQAAERLAALETALTEQGEQAAAEISALQAEVAALTGKVENSASAEVAEAAKAAAEGAAADAAALASHLATVDEDLAGLRAELSAMSTALGDAADGTGAAPAELAANLAALGARLDKAAASLDEQLAAMAARMAAVESSAADAQSQHSAALGEVETQLQAARLQAGLDVLASRLTNGLPYGAKLNEVAGMSGKAPPEALSASAANGVASAAELEASYSRFANAAVAADVRAQSGEGALGAFGWLRSQVAGRPIGEQEGEGVGAVTSRIGARVSEGDLTAALTEAEALPEHAQAGLGKWLERLRARVAAEAALETWRADIGAGG